MPAQQTEPKYISDVVFFEEDGRYAREVLFVTSPDADIDVGTVLASTDGTNFTIATGDAAGVTHVAVLLEKLPAQTTEKPLCLERGPAFVKRQGLAFDAALTAQTEIETLLEAQGIIIRDGV